MYYYFKATEEDYVVAHRHVDGSLEIESDHPSRESAATRVNYLNGGIGDQQLSLIVDQLASWLSDISTHLQALGLAVQNDRN